MKFLGRWSYRLSLPVLRLYLRRTSRAYGLLVCDGEVLLVRGWLGRQKWQLPGGGLKKGEPAPTALAREIREETGIIVEAARLELATEGRWETDKLGHHYSIFTAKLGSKPTVKLLRPELISYAWLKPPELSAANCAPEILAAAHHSDLL